MSDKREKTKAKLIHNAAYYGDLESLKHFVESGGNLASIFKKSKNKTTPLHQASFNSQHEVIRYFLELEASCNAGFVNGSSIVESVDKEGATPLQTAAFTGSLKCVKYLIKAKSDVDAVDREGATALHKAAFNGHAHVIKYLLQQGAEASFKDNNGFTPLHYASNNCYKEAIKTLVEVCSPDIQDSNGQTPLHNVVYKGNVECTTLLLENKANINASDKDGTTPLHLASSFNYVDLLDLLIKSGADVNQADNQGTTALHHASFHNHTSIVKSLLGSGAEVYPRDKTGCTPLHKAAFNGHSQVISLLLKKEPYVESQESTEVVAPSPLQYASFNGSLETMKILFEKGSDLNAKDADGGTPLHKACFRGHVEVVQWLIDNGAEVNVKDKEGATPLHKASFGGHLKVLEILIKNKAEVDSVDQDRGTPLHNASYQGHHECVEFLLTNGADPKSKEGRGATALHLAVRNGHKSCASLLIQNRVSVNEQDDKGLAPLHYAIQSAVCVSYLIEKGAKVDVKDNTGKTPFYCAVLGGYKESTVVLLDHGADVQCKDSKGLTVFENPRSLIPKDFITDLITSKEKESLDEKRTYYNVAVKRFNIKPKMGFEYLVEEKIIPSSGEEKYVASARFLHEADGLNLTKVGDYLGEHGEESLKTLDAFISLFDFTGQDFSEALRSFLSKFRLPGEAQKIDRMMERFAARYVNTNPEKFPSEDSAYLLAFSLIMLNTDAHNPQVKKKMTKEDFRKNCRGINDGQDFLPEFLEGLYDNIVTNPIKMQGENTILFSQAEKKGYLTKQGGRIKTWKRRWCVLSDNCLYYFKSQDDPDPCGIIPLENIGVSVFQTKPNTFRMYNAGSYEMKACKVGTSGSVQKGHHDEYLFVCPNEAELADWIAAIQSNIQSNPILELMKNKVNNQRLKGSTTTGPRNTFEDPKKNTSLSPSSASLTSLPSSNTFNVVSSSLHSQNPSPPEVDFEHLYHLANLCMFCTKGDAFYKQKYGNHCITGSPSPEINFFLDFNSSSLIQTLVVRYVKLESDKGLKSELNSLATTPKSLSSLSTLNVDLESRFQFDILADKIVELVKKGLKPEFKVQLTGMSFGGEICVRVAKRLMEQGYEILKVVTFGQPKTFSEKEISYYSSLPLLRVKDCSDQISELFYKFKCPGPELILLSEHYYAFTGRSQSDNVKVKISKGFVTDNEHLDEVLKIHSVESYLKKLKLRIKDAQEVKLSELSSYI